ncbi:MAG TPA: response regulator, partial [Myxococcota bacterium]|nr:response regulator [Myxococcota bacterium]
MVLGPPALRLGTEEALRERGYSVVAVVNGEQALAALLINRPDLVLLDLQLPDVSGLELAKQARNTLGHQRTPMMALGNEADIAASAHELSSIFSTVLQKPLEAKEIADAVQSLLPLRTERRGFSEKGHVVLVVDD